ncbi:MAG: tetratricopeptide repeat protein [Candidatus Omnitrophica bacterium]|nr:tetratricopeptide repeat protein [Candidatus Omnitrophota bacterium]
MPEPSPRVRAALPWLIIVAGIAAYLNSLSCPFLFDDTLWVLRNPAIRHLWPLWEVLRVDAARPVVMLSLALNYALAGEHVVSYHLVNLAIHLLSALILFGLIRRTLLTSTLRARYGRSASWLALAVALLWVVHPLLTQSVTYIIQRAELLAGVFLLTTLYCVVRGAETPHARVWYAAAVLSCCAGMASKAVMVIAPLIVGLYDRVFLAGSWRSAWRQRRFLYLGLFGSWVWLALLLASAPTMPEPTAGFALKDVAWFDYAVTQPGVILHYLRLALWPSPLVFDYDWPIARTLPAIVLPGLVVAGLWGVAIWTWRRRPPPAFLWLWVLLILVPTSSVISVTDLAAEHRMYLPLIGVVALVVFGGHALLTCAWRTPPRARWGIGCIMVSGVAIVFAVGTARRNQDYRSALVMWSDVVRKRPANARAHANLGFALAQSGQHDAAMAHYIEALRLKPTDAETHNNVGASLVQIGKLDDAIAHYREAIRLAPRYAEAYNNLGVALLRQGRAPEAANQFARALALKPRTAGVHYNLGNALATQGRGNEAIAQYADALRLEPRLPDAHNNWGNVLMLEGHVEEAQAHYAQALALDPTHTGARRNLERLRRRAIPEG